jgi:pimeloyl-ACP methyl ester carboxylesterase
MADLSPPDAELLIQDLPALARVDVASSIYSGQQGQIEYRAAGNLSNAAVLMLHGLGSSSAGYRAQFAGLSRDFHVIAWNAPGFGGSSPIPGQDAKIDDYASAVEGLLRVLGVRRLAALVGSSWGSVVAMAFARRYPALVGSLVLSAPNAARGHITGEARDAELKAWLGMADVGIPVSRAAIANRLVGPDTPTQVRQHVERLRDGMTTDGWRQAIRSLFTVYTPDIIPKVSCPIAILSGTLDQVAPYRDHAERLLAAAPRATSYPFEDCGHILKLEAPSKFNAVVREMAAQAKGNGRNTVREKETHGNRTRSRAASTR